MSFEDDNWCFVCGKNNPIGLKMEFASRGDALTAVFISPKELQGYQGIVHGGVLSALLDEIMVKLLSSRGIRTVTAKLEIEFLKPAPVGTEIFLEASVEKSRGKLHLAVSSAHLGDGTELARARGTLFSIS